MRSFFIAFFLLTTGNLFGQVSHATISATIVTPVGAEISDEIIYERIPAKTKTTLPSDNVVLPEKNDPNSFLKVIGNTFSHHITVEKNYCFLKRKTDNDKTLTEQKHTSYVGITVNFD